MAASRPYDRRPCAFFCRSFCYSRWRFALKPTSGWRMLVTERPGRLNLIGRDFKRSHIEGVPRVYASGQGGLGGASTELARARLNGARLEDLRVLFVEAPKTAGGLPFG